MTALSQLWASEHNRKQVAAVARSGPRLANLNLDTGRPAEAGEYLPATPSYSGDMPWTISLACPTRFVVTC